MTIIATPHLNESEIKNSGVHYTPPELAAFLAERAATCLSTVGGIIRVLDPACGDGTLLEAFALAVPPSTRERLELIGYEIDAVALTQANSRLANLNIHLITLHHGDFLDAVDEHYKSAGPVQLFGNKTSSQRLVDVVISNPPYVRTQALGAKRSRELAERFGLTGRVDLYHAFVKAMWSLMNPKGVLALLTSNRFLTILSGASMRQLLRNQFDLREIYDLGDTRLFGAAVLPAIVIGEKQTGSTDRPDTPFFSRIYELRKTVKVAKEFASVFAALNAKHEGNIKVGKSKFVVTQGRLNLDGDSTKPWSLESAASREWLDTIDKHAQFRFGEIASIRVGIKTTADNVFIRRSWDTLPNNQQPEPDLMHRLLTHHTAQRWKTSEAAYATVLYPHYADANGKKKAVDIARFPKALRYLESHRPQLEGRSYVIEAGRNWFEIWVSQQPSEWPRPKIVYPDIAESPTFSLDLTGAVVNGDCYWITLDHGFESDWLYLMLAVANSTFIEIYYDNVFHNKLYAGRRRFMTQYVKQFPLPPLAHPLSQRIVRGAKKLAAMDNVANAKEQEADLDLLVWEAFGLKPSEA